MAVLGRGVHLLGLAVPGFVFVLIQKFVFVLVPTFIFVLCIPDPEPPGLVIQTVAAADQLSGGSGW